MVHEGGPSEGCDTCRARKVKCSLEKPYCFRCWKAGFKCLGYLRRPRAKLNLVSYRPVPSARHESTFSQSKGHLFGPDMLIMSPDWPLADRSMNFFLSQFVVVSGTDLNGGWFDFVPQVLRHHGSSVPLSTALRAVSLLSLANRYRRQDLIVNALHLNGKALEAVNETLRSPSEATEDSTFAAILLLCLFGHINGDLKLQIGIHAAGMFRLLALRNATRSRSPYAESFNRHLVALLVGLSSSNHSQIDKVKQHLDNNDRYISFGAVPEHEVLSFAPLHSSKDLFERLIMLWPHSAAISTRFRDMMTIRRELLDSAAVIELLRIGQEFEDVLDRAAQDLDPAWHFGTEIRGSARRNLTFYTTSGKALVYHNPWTMAIWHAYRITRISLHTALASTYGMLEDENSAGLTELPFPPARTLQNSSLAIIDSMNKEICASIPWSLGQINHQSDNDLPEASKASLSIAGLRAVANGIYARQQHTLQARAALEQIAHRFGIKGALV